MSPDSIIDRCRTLLTTRAEGAQLALAAEVLDAYEDLPAAARRAVLLRLGPAFDPPADAVLAAAEAWAAEQSVGHLQQLLRIVEPPRRQLLGRLHLPVGATQRLVALRADLLGWMADEPDLGRIDVDLRYLLRTWFSRGFLELRRIDWSTPAFILERIATNEAVHEVSDWQDLRARVRPADRRCYGFFHPAMPDEPLIFVMVALTKELPTTIASVLETDRVPLPAENARMAVFYAISNCQPGLRGVSLGNFLIKQVAAELAADLPQVTEFRTLSPITGLSQWMTQAHAEVPGPEALSRIAARYLLTATRRDGQPLDAVGRFHLGNGASLDRILSDADPSPRGVARAHGMMASYRYDLASVAANHDAYATDRRILASPGVESLAGLG